MKHKNTTRKGLIRHAATRILFTLSLALTFSAITGHQACAQIINLVAGTGGWGYGGDGGPATAAIFQGTKGIAVDPSGNVYIADYENDIIRLVDLTGTINTIAGTPGVGGFSGDGGPATAATMSNVTGIALDPSYTILYVCDISNAVIRKIDLTSGIISTIAGTPGTPGYGGDGGPATAALLSAPNDVKVDASGNVYIADAGNNRVRMVDGSGIISTIAGNGTGAYGGDGGPATAANLYFPAGLAIDAVGNYYIADPGNEVIRMVDLSGTISTVAGNNALGSGFSGNGGPATNAQLATPVGVAVDASGNIFIGDFGNLMVRRVDAGGTITTYAGTGSPGNTGDGGPATACTFFGPEVVDVDVWGDLFIGGKYNSNVREIAVPRTHPCYDKTSLDISESTDKEGNCVYTATASVSTVNEVLGYQWQGIGSAVVHRSHATSDVFTFTLPPGGSATVTVTIYLVDTLLTDTLNGPCCQAVMSQDVKCDGGGGKKMIRPAAKSKTTGGGISIFPNPAENIVTITSTQDNVNTVEVVNVNGQAVASHTYNNSKQVDISLDNLPPGVYLLRINGVVSKPVLKAK